MASISVVLPTRNRPAFLREALATVAAQSHLEMELVLVRDGGTPLDDEARGFLATLEFPYILVERDDPPEGLALARDRGIERARGDAIAFLDDDDLWERGHVKQLADALQSEPELTAIQVFDRRYRGREVTWAGTVTSTPPAYTLPYFEFMDTDGIHVIAWCARNGGPSAGTTVTVRGHLASNPKGAFVLERCRIL